MKKQTILNQIKSHIIKQIKIWKPQYESIIIERILESQNIDDLIIEVDYWQMCPSLSTAKEYIFSIINSK
jgi:hypothetical protein